MPTDQALIAELNKKYANRVQLDVGLCICVFDLSAAGEGKVRYGDGCLWYKGVPVFSRLVWFEQLLQLVQLSSGWSCSAHLHPRSSLQKSSRQMKTAYDVSLSSSIPVQLSEVPVTLGFFDDIYIPAPYLPQPSALYAPSSPDTSTHTHPPQ
jgi:DNA-directed RNA polymerase III subunit RPC8